MASVICGPLSGFANVSGHYEAIVKEERIQKGALMKKSRFRNVLEPSWGTITQKSAYDEQHGHG